MKLSQGQKDKAIQALSDVLSLPCNVCHGKTWILNDTIFELREFLGGTLVLSSKAIVFPVVAVLCNGCGNTLFFNAIQLGLIKKANDTSQK